jgi:hypothetical protein
LDEWIDMVNTVLNPWDVELVAEDFSILTRGPDGALFVTDGNWAGNQNWGRGSAPLRPAQQPTAPSTPTPPSNAAEPPSNADTAPDDGEELDPPYDIEPPGPDDETNDFLPDDPYPDAGASPDTDTTPPAESPPDLPPDADLSDD